jgi:hypothetical protein
MNLPAIIGPRPRVGATVYLVAWRDSLTGVVTDAGIYSEATPTCVGPLGKQHLRPVAVLAMHSRLEAAQGGYQRASDQLAELVAKTPSLAWATRCRTFRMMQNRPRPGARLIARAVVR